MPVARTYQNWSHVTSVNNYDKTYERPALGNTAIERQITNNKFKLKNEYTLYGQRKKKKIIRKYDKKRFTTGNSNLFLSAILFTRHRAPVESRARFSKTDVKHSRGVPSLLAYPVLFLLRMCQFGHVFLLIVLSNTHRKLYK